MIMLGDKKKMASLVLSKRQGVAESNSQAFQERAEEPAGSGYDLKVVATELIKAVEAKDVDRVAAALRASHSICEAYEGED